MINTALLTSPDLLSPINDIYGNDFVLGNTSSNATNFKYLIKLNANGSFLVRESVPPRPGNGQGLYSGFVPLLANVTYNLHPTITALTYATQSIVSYNINYGLEYSPGLTFAQLLDVGSSPNDTFGIIFGTSSGFQVGDLINITTTNPFLSGTSTVTSIISGTAIAVNTPFTFSSAIETGTITDLQRFTGTSSTFYGINGTRQYAQGDEDYTFTYALGDTTGSQNPQSWLSNYATYSYKPIQIGEWETLSFCNYKTNFAAGRAIYQTFNSNNTLLQTATLSLTLNASGTIGRYDIPSGTSNLALLGVSFTNVDHYTVRLVDNTSTFGATRSDPRIYGINRDCSIYDNVRIAFLNRLGAFDFWTFTQDDKQVYDATRTEYTQQLPWNYNIGDRGRTILSQKIVETHTINTNWISESDYAFLAELVTSVEAYVIDETTGLGYPIIINDTSYEFKTAYRDTIFNLTVNFSYAYNIESQRQ